MINNETFTGLQCSDSSIWRRFACKNESKRQAAIALIEEKGLSRDDMKLLLETFELNPNVTEQNI